MKNVNCCSSHESIWLEVTSCVSLLQYFHTLRFLLCVAIWRSKWRIELTYFLFHSTFNARLLTHLLIEESVGAGWKRKIKTVLSLLNDSDATQQVLLQSLLIMSLPSKKISIIPSRRNNLIDDGIVVEIFQTICWSYHHNNSTMSEATNVTHNNFQVHSTVATLH